MRHPDELELALYAASDLDWRRRFSVGRHVRACAGCAQQVESIRESRSFLAEAAGEMPAGLHWGRMSAEIRANIKLGLEAGAIAGPVAGQHDPPARPMGWRIAAAVASLTVLTLSGLWLQMPRPVAVARGNRAGDARVVLKSGRAGIELAENGRSLSLLHRASERATFTVGVQGELRARYVDEDTGEVTIHHVYSE